VSEESEREGVLRARARRTDHWLGGARASSNAPFPFIHTEEDATSWKEAVHLSALSSR